MINEGQTEEIEDADQIKNVSESKEKSEILKQAPLDWKIAIASWIAQIIITVIGFCVVTLSVLPTKIDDLKEFMSLKIEDIDKRLTDKVENIETNIDSIQQNMQDEHEKIGKEYKNLSERVTGMETSFAEMSKYYDWLKEMVQNNLISSVAVGTTEDSAWIELSAPKWNANADSELMNTVLQFANTRMVFHYTESEKDIFYAVQYNDQKQWNGDCLINVYEHGDLILAATTLYENGTELSAKQVFKSGNLWMYAERIYLNDNDYGDTWKYADEIEFKQIIDFNETNEEKLYNPEAVRKKFEKCVQWYRGEIKDSKYSDNTGRSFLISWDEDGNVRTVYLGDFFEGTFNSSSYSSWYISRNPNTAYNYYKGPFKNGHPALDGNNPDVYFDEAISKEEKNYILKDTPFSDVGKWIDELFDEENHLPELVSDE